jgi:hypothetical protein
MTASYPTTFAISSKPMTPPSAPPIDFQLLLQTYRSAQSALDLAVLFPGPSPTDDPTALEIFVTDFLFPALVPSDLALVRALTIRETQERRRFGGCGDGLYLLCFMLYSIGQPEDLFLLYEAKHANFDCECMLDHDFLQMGRSRQEQLAFLNKILTETPSLHARYASLDEELCNAFDIPNYESPERFSNAVCAYYKSSW